MKVITLGNGGIYNKSHDICASPFFGEAFIFKKERKTTMKKIIVSLLVLVLAFTAFMFGCSEKETPDVPETKVEDTQVSLKSDEKSFVFEVVDKNGEITQTTVISDGKYVGEVLQEFELIEGEEGPYGIYIKKVNGITADYDIDGTYWAFYVDGEKSMKGADQVEIVEGATYSFRVETM